MPTERLLGPDGVERPSAEPGRFAGYDRDAAGRWQLVPGTLARVTPLPAFPLETARLTVRAFRADDLDALHAILARGDVNRFLYSGASTRAHTRAALRRKIGQAELRAGVRRLSLAAELRETGELVGSLTLFLRSAVHRRGEIGFVFHPDHHGRGLATEAAVELLRIGFADAGLRRIEGRCDARNIASARVLERIGMRREAHFVENEWVKDEWTDELVYALLDREWRAARATAG